MSVADVLRVIAGLTAGLCLLAVVIAIAFGIDTNPAHESLAASTFGGCVAVCAAGLVHGRHRDDDR